MVTPASVEEDYRSAFEDFSRKAQCVQFLAQHPSSDQKVMEIALWELEKAHLAYDAARDEFVQSLLPALIPAAPRNSRDRREDVQTIAELLWEGAGRPSDTAEEDWRRAEVIVKRAVEAMRDHN